MALTAGTRLGPYEILGLIGAGGMGEVYRAKDTRLDRIVAIKVLPAHLTDPEHRARFEREARTIAGLSHPHICSLYDVGEYEASLFLVLEHLDGHTLAERLRKGPVPIDQALEYATQIAEALSAAHRTGVIHRDLKPANVMLTRSGVKLLDFGLAKLRPQAEEPLVSGTTTHTQPLTGEGTIVGTLHYMAPEQLEGKEIDARADLFAFGSVLYEMVTGHRAFGGQSHASIISAIMSSEPPPPSMLQPLAPPVLDRIVRDCLMKDPTERQDSAHALANELRWLVRSGTSRTVSSSLPSQRTVRRAASVTSAIIAALLLIVWWERGKPPVTSPRIDSLAVLPFKNLMGDPKQNYFVEGMQDALIAELSKIRALKVTSRTSTARYLNSGKAMSQISRELGAEGLVEGSVLRDGETVRITVNLIHGASDRSLWTSTYERELNAVFALQSDVARAIARQIQVEVSSAEEVRPARGTSVGVEAQDAYLRARYFANRWPAPEYGRCVEYFQDTIARAPDWAEGHAGLGTCYTLLAWAEPPTTVLPRARDSAMRAQALDPNLAETYEVLGSVHMFYDWDWAAAKRDIMRAVELNPSSVNAHVLNSSRFVFLGLDEDAIREARRAVELDPISLFSNRALAFVYLSARRFSEYAAQAQVTLNLAPNDGVAKFDIAWAYALMGERDKSREAAKAAFGQDPGGYLSALVFAALGERRRALQDVSQAEAARAEAYVDAFWIGAVYASLGLSDEAFRWLEKSYEEHSASLVQLRTFPALDPLHRDPRFKRLSERIHLPN